MRKLCTFAAIAGASFGKLTVILVLKRTIKAWTTTIHLSPIPNPIMCPSLLKLFLNSFLCKENTNEIQRFIYSIYCYTKKLNVLHIIGLIHLNIFLSFFHCSVIVVC